MKKSVATMKKSVATKKYRVNPKKFVNLAAEMKCEDLIKSRPVLLEKGFVFSKTPNLGLPSYVSEVLQHRKWQKFVEHPESPIVPLVREFYANLLKPDQSFVTVRGVKIELSCTVANTLFGLEDFEDDFSKLVENPSAKLLKEVLKSTTVPGTVWNTSAKNTKTVRRSSLLPKAKVWCHFIKNRIMPTTHDTTVSVDRMIMLHCILSGKKINLGNVLVHELCAAAMKTHGKLFFSSLITQICKHFDVPFLEDKEIAVNKGAFTSQLIDKVANEVEFATQKPGTSGPSTSAAASGSNSAAPNLQILNSILLKLESLEKKQFQLFKYLKSRDMVLKKALMANFTKPYPTFPKFPDELFENVSATGTRNTPSQDSFDTESDEESLIRKMKSIKKGKQHMEELSDTEPASSPAENVDEDEEDELVDPEILLQEYLATLDQTKAASNMPA